MRYVPTSEWSNPLAWGTSLLKKKTKIKMKAQTPNLDAYDMQSGECIERPAIDTDLIYDFDVKPPKSKRWLYVGSTNYLEEFNTEKFKSQISQVEENKGLWRILNSKSGKIVKTNDRGK